MPDDRCPDCGAAVSGGREGCEAIWHQLAYGEGLTHPAAFDAYCMQHLPKYCASAKSYAAHLTRLCCGLEYGADPTVYATIQRWLNGQRPLNKPQILPFLGELTIVDVVNGRTSAERAEILQRWLEAVWAAYAPQHPLAHRWIQEALNDNRP